MRKKIVAGNWKMNLDAQQADSLYNDLLKITSSEVEILIFPTSLYVQKFASNETPFKVGVQNCHPKESGAFTGEIAVSQLKSCGATHSLVGHSERRMYFQESHLFLKEKVNACLAHAITPVFCCGEPQEIRENGEEYAYVKKQLEESLFHLNEKELLKTIIAYEPVWAIGTGLTASSEQAEAMHKEIRSWISTAYSEEIANKIPILYGGSCNASNAHELFSCANVDGGLIGGASLDALSFAQIIESF